jgi:hypothetical protein
VPEFDGKVLRAQAARFKDLAGREAPALIAEFETNTSWKDTLVSHDRAEVIVSGLVDFVIRWPMVRQMAIWTAGRTRSNSIPIDELAPYELGDILGGGAPIPNYVVTLTQAALERIDQLAIAAFNAPVSRLGPVMPALAQVSVAVDGRRPFDRIGPLWSALTLAQPAGSDLAFATVFVRGSQFVAAERERTNAWRALFLSRSLVRRDRWFHARIREALTGRTRSVERQMQMATVFAYAFRSAIAHGHWSAIPERRAHALACEEWLWNLVERALEQRLLGTRLPRVRAHSGSTVSF